ncbi:MAG: hypothetical protein ABI200_07070 [Gaiellales bacterium]
MTSLTPDEHASQTPPAAMDGECADEAPRTLHRPRRAPRRWLVLGLLAAAALLIVGLACFNWYVDPGREYRSTRASSRVDALEKLTLIERWKQPPEVLVLGSSTVMKFDPREIERITGKTSFNAGISGARPSVDWAIAAYVDELHPGELPELVIGLNSFAFYSGNDSWLRQDARMRRQLDGTGLRAQLRRYTALISLPMAADSVTSLYRRARAFGAAGEPQGAARAGSRRVDDLGFLLRAYPTDETVVAKRTTRAAGRYRRVVASWSKEGGEMEAEQAEHFERLLRFANDQGRRPIVIITPISPRAWDLLADTTFAAQQRRVVGYLESLHDSLDFTLVDASHGEMVGVHEPDFHDASHISAEAATRMLTHAFAERDAQSTP